MSKNPYRNDRYGGTSYKNYFEEPKIDLDDEIEVATDKEVEVEEADEPKPIENKVSASVEDTGRAAIVNVLSNLRESPSMGSNVLSILNEGTKITIYDNPGDFYKVKYNSTTGYLKKTLCKLL